MPNSDEANGVHSKAGAAHQLLVQVCPLSKIALSRLIGHYVTHTVLHVLRIPTHQHVYQLFVDTDAGVWGIL